MIVSVAFVPDTPLLVPDVAVRGDALLTSLRRATSTAIVEAVGVGVDLVLVGGRGPEARSHPPSDWGDLRPYGVDVRVSLGGLACGGRPSLSPALSVGAWLLRDALHGTPRRTADAPVQAFAVPDEASETDLDAWATDVTDLPGRVCVVVVGSGAAGHGPRAPGGASPEAVAFDATVATAVAECDVGTMAGLDSAAGLRLLASGVRVWQLAGRAVAASPAGTGPAAARSLVGRLTWQGQPFGVGYLVGSWLPR